MNIAGWLLLGVGLFLMLLGALLEARRQPAVIQQVSKNPLVALITAIAALIKELTGMFKILKDYSSGRFFMAMGLLLVLVGVLVGLTL